MRHTDSICRSTRLPTALLAALLTLAFTSHATAQSPPAAAPAAEATEGPSLAAQAVLASNPTTPAEMARAAQILADLNEPKLAREFLKKIVDAQPDATTAAAMVDRFSSAMFVNLSTRPELQPEATEVANLVLRAWNEQLRSPERVGELIKQLGDPSEIARSKALRGLVEARGAAVGPLVDVLADPARAAEHPLARGALVALRSDAVEPLLGMLEKSEPAVMAQVIRVLAEMNARPAILYLLGPYTAETTDPAVRQAAGDALRRLVGHVPSKAEAVALLVGRAREYFSGTRPVDHEIQGEATVWSWDTGKKASVAQTVPADHARRMAAARLARDAFALAPNDPQVKLLYLATMLEQSAYENGLDKPSEDREGSAARRAAGFGGPTIEALLDDAMVRGHPAAATVAAEILGRIGKAEDLLHPGPQMSPLAAALHSPDRRLRFAAVEAILKLSPTQPFAGSSNVVPVLAFFAGSSGKPRALLAGPISADMRIMADVLARQGVQSDTAISGREMTLKAVDSPDYQLAYLDVHIDQPTAEFTLQQLRRDPRSADLPVALTARDGVLPVAERIARRDARALAFPRPHRDQSIEWQSAELNKLAAARAIPHEQRQRQAAAALEMLAAVADQGGRLYDVLRAEKAVLRALQVPELAERAAAVLGKLGTADGQRALVELAGRETQPIELRRVAVKHFAESVEARGVLLTTAEIERQYGRYNASAQADPDTLQVLASILDAIEAPTQAIRAAPPEKTPR